MLESQLQALLSVKKMVQSMEAIRKNLKNACIFMVIVAIIQLISLIWCSHRILGALYFQAKFLRKAASRQIALEIQAAQVDFDWCGSSEPSKPTKISPASPGSAHSICGSVRSISDKKIFVSHWKEYLPSLDRRNKVSARLWNSGPFQKTQEQIIGDGLKDMSFFHRKLRRYAINTFWHIVLAALVKLSYIILCILLSTFKSHTCASKGKMYRLIEPYFRDSVLGAFDHLAILHFEVAIFQWVNITWNCGVGFILGIVSADIGRSNILMAMPQRGLNGSPD
jgi:hypothetical protein